jgi:hypothetical protein
MAGHGGEEEWDDVEWIDMAQNWHQWRALVNIVLNIRLPKMLGSS